MFTDIEFEENSERQKLKKKIWKFSIFLGTSTVSICLCIISYQVGVSGEFQNTKMLLKFTLFFDALLFGIIPLSIKILRDSKSLLAFTISLYLIPNFAAVFFALDNTALNLKDINNFNTLIQQIKKEQPTAKETRILYFNDKYIFIETASQNKKYVLIKKMDDIFN